MADFVIEGFEPAYREAARSGLLADRVAEARAELRSCRACPRDCEVDRWSGETGTCHTGRWAIVSSAFPHHGEEQCLRGRGGSGTIFFAFCNLRCVFCQNWDISQRPDGREMDADEIGAMMVELQRLGCHNINFVTPEHVAPQVVEAIAVAAEGGLRIPIVYNTSAYDGLSSLHLMDGLVDIYMPDFKFWAPESGRRLAGASDYPEVARRAVAQMHRQTGVLKMGPDGLARRGVLVRHLVMPGLGDETAAIMNWLAEDLSPDTFVNLMAQYRPDHRVPGSDRYGYVDRRVTAGEMADARRAAEAAGLWRFSR